jgi:hypothetical protein
MRLATPPATLATVAFSHEDVLTFFSRVGVSAAFRIASATCSGVLRIGQIRLPVGHVPGVLWEWGVGRPRLDQGDRHRALSTS